MSCTSDATVNLTEKMNHANRVNADDFFSIYFNSFTSSPRGKWNEIGTNNETNRIPNAIHTEVVNRVLNKYGI